MTPAFWAKISQAMFLVSQAFDLAGNACEELVSSERKNDTNEQPKQKQRKHIARNIPQPQVAVSDVDKAKARQLMIANGIASEKIQNGK